MNTAIIRYIVGYILRIEALLMLLPCLVAAIYREQEGFFYLLVALLCGLVGIFMTLRKPKDHVFYLKEGCVATSLSWIALRNHSCDAYVCRCLCQQYRRRYQGVPFRDSDQNGNEGIKFLYSSKKHQEY